MLLRQCFLDVRLKKVKFIAANNATLLFIPRKIIHRPMTLFLYLFSSLKILSICALGERDKSLTGTNILFPYTIALIIKIYQKCMKLDVHYNYYSFSITWYVTYRRGIKLFLLGGDFFNGTMGYTL